MKSQLLERLRQRGRRPPRCGSSLMLVLAASSACYILSLGFVMTAFSRDRPTDAPEVAVREPHRTSRKDRPPHEASSKRRNRDGGEAFDGGNDGDVFCEEPTAAVSRAAAYRVCNGFSNQLLGHAAYIADLIQTGGTGGTARVVRISDAFIFNGVQTEDFDGPPESERRRRLESDYDYGDDYSGEGDDAADYPDVDDDHTEDAGKKLKNVFVNGTNSVPLSSIIDAEALLRTVRKRGVKACFVPYGDVISSATRQQKKRQPRECPWLPLLAKGNDDLAMELLDAMKPSRLLSAAVETTLSNLKERLRASKSATLSDGVCLHHRDGPDWHEHCRKWKDRKRNNCLNNEHAPIGDLVANRIPARYKKKWVYYIGDTAPASELVSRFDQLHQLRLYHRGRDELLSNNAVRKITSSSSGDDGDAPSLETHRDLFAAVDFFVCRRIGSFVGNSVSTFSALQIATRHGKKSSWYNSGSIPLMSEAFKVHHVPIVYTYTEWSHVLGKQLLKASILSARKAFGGTVDIHVIYHGSLDEEFLKWLKRRRAIIHKHEPAWIPIVDAMRLSGDHGKSHLYAHRGNYIGTWQRIDIPVFVDAEYCLLLDADTIVREKFTLADFGGDLPRGIAFSTEMGEDEREPLNAGVALLNVPKLRETYVDFVRFIEEHANQNQTFKRGPSDQGAYLDFYSERAASEDARLVRFLEPIFNVKPYYRSKENFDGRKIVHFHGLKPHDILKGLMGHHFEDFSPAVQVLRYKVFGSNSYFLCLTLRDFGISIVQDEETLEDYCELAFDGGIDEINKRTACVKFFTELARRPEGEDCTEITRSLGFTKHESLEFGDSHLAAPDAVDTVAPYLPRRCPEGDKLYLEMYPDVKTELEKGNDNFESPFQHWEIYGRKEGRDYACNRQKQDSSNHSRLSVGLSYLWSRIFGDSLGFVTTAFSRDRPTDVSRAPGGVAVRELHRIMWKDRWVGCCIHKIDGRSDTIAVAAADSSTPRNEGDVDALWRGDATGAGPVGTLRVSIVVAHCDKDLGWLADFLGGARIIEVTIVSKCGSEIDIADLRAGLNVERGISQIELPNVGRCDHTVAYWMSRMSLDDVQENDVVVFLKDSLEIQRTGTTRSFQEMLQITTQRGFGCLHVPRMPGLSYYHLSQVLEDFHLDEYDGSYEDVKFTNEFFRSKYNNLGEWVKDMNLSLPRPLTPVCYKGNFAVKSKRITSVSHDTFRALEENLSRADNIIEGHYAERIWASLLSEPLPESIAGQLIERARSVLLQKEAECGALMGKTSFCNSPGYVVYEDSWSADQWIHLSEKAKRSAILLGFDEDIWDNDSEIPLYSKYFRDLSGEQKRAVDHLGLHGYFKKDDSDLPACDE